MYGKVIVSVHRDLTEHKKAEEELTTEKLFTEKALDVIEDIFYVFDTNGKFLKWNKTFSTVSGYTDKELAKMKPTAFFSKKEAVIVAKSIGQVFKKGRSQVKANFRNKRGKPILMEFTGTVLKSTNGKVFGFAGTGRKIEE